MSLSPSLLSIIAHARSGALDRAWTMFAEAGYDRIDDDAAVLSVRGRLLKDRAIAARGAERQRYYRQSAESYARAADIAGTTYPLINAATLSLLAGRHEQAVMLAQRVLDKMRNGGDDAETPYYRAATKAEALLLVGQIGQGKSALAEAISLAPKAYEDHASTLRQFALILGALNEDADWLDVLRPPRSLHFAGHMAPQDTGALGKRIRKLIQEERIGFGYGAIAAGADILIAEALLDAGAELHLVLPAPPNEFRDASVSRFGADWATRFDKLLDAADSVRAIAPGATPLSPLALQLAAEIAMGRCVMQAEALMTEPVQLLVLDKKTPLTNPVGSSGWIGALWKESGRRQLLLSAPRTAADGRAERSPTKRDTLAAKLRIEVSGADTDRLATAVLPQLARILTKDLRGFVSCRWTGEAFVAAFENPGAAARAGLSALTEIDTPSLLRIAGHYGIMRRANDPFTAEPILLGPPVPELIRIAASTPAGAIHVSEDFAAALCAGKAEGRPRIEYVGESEQASGEPVQLYSLKRCHSEPV